MCLFYGTPFTKMNRSAHTSLKPNTFVYAMGTPEWHGLERSLYCTVLCCTLMQRIHFLNCVLGNFGNIDNVTGHDWNCFVLWHLHQLRPWADTGDCSLVVLSRKSNTVNFFMENLGTSDWICISSDTPLAWADLKYFRARQWGSYDNPFRGTLRQPLLGVEVRGAKKWNNYQK